VRVLPYILYKVFITPIHKSVQKRESRLFSNTRTCFTRKSRMKSFSFYSFTSTQQNFSFQSCKLNKNNKIKNNEGLEEHANSNQFDFGLISLGVSTV
jgi:hypothetical protein